MKLRNHLLRHSTLFLINSYGVIKSLKLMLQLSCINGAPSTEAAADEAVTPGITSTSSSNLAEELDLPFHKFQNHQYLLH